MCAIEGGEMRKKKKSGREKGRLSDPSLLKQYCLKRIPKSFYIPSTRNVSISIVCVGKAKRRTKVFCRKKEISLVKVSFTLSFFEKERTCAKKEKKKKSMLKKSFRR